MRLRDYLKSLTPTERDFICGLDYGSDIEEHRRQLDIVIDRGGDVEMELQYWHPYEVIELGKNWLQDGHEREFVACAAIVMHNIASEADKTNDLEIGLSVVTQNFPLLAREHQSLLQPLITQISKNS